MEGDFSGFKAGGSSFKAGATCLEAGAVGLKAAAGFCVASGVCREGGSEMRLTMGVFGFFRLSSSFFQVFDCLRVFS